MVHTYQAGAVSKVVSKARNRYRFCAAQIQTNAPNGAAIAGFVVTNSVKPSPEALLTGHNDLRALGRNLLLHLVQELGVGLHVAAPKPPATHAQSCSLLDQGTKAQILLINIDRNADAAINRSLLVSNTLCWQAETPSQQQNQTWQH